MPFQTALPLGNKPARSSSISSNCIRRTSIPGTRTPKPAVAAISVISLIVLAALSVSCGGNGKLPATGTGNTAYVTLPNEGSVLMVHIDGTNGAIAPEGTTPGNVGYSPHGIALAPNKNFLYVANSESNDISTFSIAGDGSLSTIGLPTSDGGLTPWEAIVDPSGHYLLVTNTGVCAGVGAGCISVFSMNSSTGALTLVSNPPVSAGGSPSEIVMPPVGNLVYTSDSSSGWISAFTFDSSTGALTPVGQYYSGLGASAMATDNSGQFLYVANTTANNISAFSIAPGGQLTALTSLGSPYAPSLGTSPGTLVAVPNSDILYATTPGSSYSIWCFEINALNGQLTIANDSPFSQSAGGQFAIIDTNGSYFFIGSSESNGIAAYTYDSNTGQPTAVDNSPFSIGAMPGRMVIVP
jgi:6-phosphogluconolactonase (cycloisomerase 2 family)